MSSSVGMGRPNLSNLGEVDVSVAFSTVDPSISPRNPIDLEFVFLDFLVKDNSLDLPLDAPKPPPPPLPPAQHDVGFGRD